MLNLPTVVALPAVLLMSFVVIPTQLANKFPRYLRLMVTGLSGAQALLAAFLAIAYATGSLSNANAAVLSTEIGNLPVFSVLYDGFSALMLALVSFVGWVICKYSIRYMDGQAAGGRYFRWTAFTLGSVSLMVISGNLLMFFAAWLLTSLGLHQLLLHFRERPTAARAAWTKFSISRIGDAALLGAIAIIWQEFGTFDFGSLFARINSDAFVPTPAMEYASLLLVCGAVTKSAQFPFHTWLPQTMDTPTPVSALMHAGIVNGGGFLIIRMSPFVSLAPWTLTLLAIVGLTTACYAAVVMLTQSSVKGALAYSTIAQMGFMMLQCGLGAFSAAMLHIVAHSLYKAHAFLSSGGVLADQAAMRGASNALSIDTVPWGKMVGVGILNIAFLAIAFTAFGISPAAKPGGVLLGSLLCIALTSWMTQIIRSASSAVLVRGLAACFGMCLLYVGSYVGVDNIVASSLPRNSQPASLWLITVIAITAFVGMFALQLLRTRQVPPTWLNALRIHASNGFYVDAWLRRTFGHLAIK